MAARDQNSLETPSEVLYVSWNGESPLSSKGLICFSFLRSFPPVVLSFCSVSPSKHVLLFKTLRVCMCHEVHFSRILTGFPSLKCVYLVTGFVVRNICLSLNKSAKKLCIKPKNIQLSTILMQFLNLQCASPPLSLSNLVFNTFLNHLSGVCISCEHRGQKSPSDSWSWSCRRL